MVWDWLGLERSGSDEKDIFRGVVEDGVRGGFRGEDGMRRREVGRTAPWTFASELLLLYLEKVLCEARNQYLRCNA